MHEEQVNVKPTLDQSALNSMFGKLNKRFGDAAKKFGQGLQRALANTRIRAVEVDPLGDLPHDVGDPLPALELPVASGDRAESGL